MPENLLTLSQGLSASKLELANATAAQVMSGKTFYAGNKELKTGTLSLTGNATIYNVLYGNTFYSNSFTKQTGAMKNNGSWNSTINPGSSVTIPAGYHNGGGKVTANSAKSGMVLGIYMDQCPNNGNFDWNKSYNTEYMSDGRTFKKSCRVLVSYIIGNGVYINGAKISVGNNVIFDKQIVATFYSGGTYVTVSNGTTISVARNGAGDQTSSNFLIVVSLA